MAPNPLALDRIVDHVLDCMCSSLTQIAEELADQDIVQPGCPCDSCKVPGLISWDGCSEGTDECAGGLLRVTVTRLYPSSTFPTQASGLDACEPKTLVADIGVVLLRCMPVVGDDDEDCGPSCAALAAAARIQHIDMLTIQRAVTCCVPHLPGRRKPLRTSVLSHQAVGPLAECVGSELHLLVDLGDPCGCGELPIPDPSV